MIHYEHCPVCANTSIERAFAAKDYTVSQADFPIWKCNSCSLLFTQDVPSADEIGKYYASEDYISHTDTNEGFINSLYHTIRKITLRQKLKLVQQKTGRRFGSLLDIGCGTGAFLNVMQGHDWSVTGLEPDEAARKKAFELYQLEPLPAENIFVLQQNFFDAITAWHVLEHVHQLHEYVSGIKNLLAPAGKAFIAVPNYTSYDAGFYKSNWAAYDVPRHLYHFSPRSMATLLQLHGLKIDSVKPMWFDSFYVSMLSEKNKAAGGNIFSAFFAATLSNVKALFYLNKCSSLIYIISADKDKG